MAEYSNPFCWAILNSDHSHYDAEAAKSSDRKMFCGLGCCCLLVILLLIGAGIGIGFGIAYGLEKNK